MRIYDAKGQCLVLPSSTPHAHSEASATLEAIFTLSELASLDAADSDSAATDFPGLPLSAL